MDPNATFRLILEYLSDGEPEAAIEAIEDLQGWLDGGGCGPINHPWKPASPDDFRAWLDGLHGFLTRHW